MPPPSPADERPLGRLRVRTIWMVCTLVMAIGGLVDAVFNYFLMDALGRPRTFWFMATAAVPSWLVLAALLPIPFRMAERFPFQDRPFVRTALIHLPAAIALAVLHLVSAVILSDVILSSRAAQTGFLLLLGGGFSNYLVFDVMLYAGIVGLYFAVDYQQRYREQTAAAARLQARLAEAQVQALRSQLDPHFLFNALNAISGTALRRDPERTAGLISDLSQLLRRALRHPAAEVPLEEELEFLHAYVSIERARMGGRLDVHVDVPDALLGRRVPTLLLQPLAENAVRHGLADKPGGGRLTVRVRESGGRLTIEILDDGLGIRSAAGQSGEGIGLGNTRARLRELYGEGASLVLFNRPEGGTSVRVDLPSRAARAEGSVRGAPGPPSGAREEGDPWRA
jgi:hypothetical protein